MINTLNNKKLSISSEIILFITFPPSSTQEGADTTEKREVEALHKLPKALACKRRVIITYDEEKTIKDEYGVIEVIPCWKWLIQQ